MEEKRKFKRFKRNISTALQVLDPNLDRAKNKTHHFMISDICAGGAFLTTTQPFAEGTKVITEISLPMRSDLAFNMDEHCIIKAKGVVVRADIAGIALSFQKDFKVEFVSP